MAGEQRQIENRSRVENAFADQKTRNDLVGRTIGIARATTGIALVDPVSNVRRLPIIPTVLERDLLAF